MDPLSNELDSMESFCRLCGSDQGVKVSIFEPGTEHVKKIHKLLPITINEHDPFPKAMCHRCSFKVNEFFDFRTNCIKAQEMFKSKVPWLRDIQPACLLNQHPPMVEVPLNSLNTVSPNEKKASSVVSSNGNHLSSKFIDENDSMIIIDDDDDEEDPPTYTENYHMSTSLLNECHPQEKIIMKIKKTDLKKKPRTKSIWNSKTRKRKGKSRKACKITEVYTTIMDEYQSTGDIENDPLCLSPNDNIENKDIPQYLPKSQNNDHNNVENGILKNDEVEETVTLPNYILRTHIPRVGYAYSCEKCGRTFLSPQPASLHICDLKCIQNDRPKKDIHAATPDPPKIYSCNQCDQGFTRHSQLISHQKKHLAESSSDDNFTPHKHKRRHHKKKKSKHRLLSNDTFLTSFDERDPGIIRHSLLSSESE